jgi:hypothetical protein
MRDGKSGIIKEGFQPFQKGYTPITADSGVQGGYRPTTGQNPSSPPATVPNQPSSVQPAKDK